MEHVCHVRHTADIPLADVTIERFHVTENPIHVRHARHVPIPDRPTSACGTVLPLLDAFVNGGFELVLGCRFKHGCGTRSHCNDGYAGRVSFTVEVGLGLGSELGL